MSDDPIIAAIEAATRKALSEAGAPRYHLGASQLGDRCIRKVFYGFRKAANVRHTGRLLRLFNRGHEEEFRLVRWLRMAGFEVRDYTQRLCRGGGKYVLFDWDEKIPYAFEDVSTSPHHIQLAIQEGIALEQYGFSALAGHFSGSSDGRLRGPGLPDGWGLTEFKTHNDKSFQQLKQKGVLTSKPVHYVQMQIYMAALRLPWGLYAAVNKNDDEVYTEVVHAKPELADQYSDRALAIIQAKEAPQRLSNDPSWWECRFCDYREVCHYDKAPAKGCASCAMARPDIENGGWQCGRFHTAVPQDYLLVGCDAWEAIK